jgi:hypothetical protein
MLFGTPAIRLFNLSQFFPALHFPKAGIILTPRRQGLSIRAESYCLDWLGNILRRPDLARKLAGARLELGKDEKGNNKATFWLAGEGIDPRSFSLEGISLIRMAFSTEVQRGYKLQLANSVVIVPLE